MKYFFLFLLMPLFTSTPQEQPTLKKYFNEYNQQGCIAIYDQAEDNWVWYDSAACFERYIPASTFKIFNTMVALETGVADSSDFILHWDGSKQFMKAWEQDHNLKSAYKYSVVWYYQELARRIGSEQMQHYLKAADYGNHDISGGIDMFWLKGGLRISPVEQVELLRKIETGELPFSERTLSIARDVFIYDKNENYVLRAKTGWSEIHEINYGWFVGYFTYDENVIYFALSLQDKEGDQEFVNARRDIVFDIFRGLGYIN